MTLPTDSPFFSLLRARLDHLGDRQRLIAENVANASTPGFTPRDVDAKAFTRALEAAAPKPGEVAPARTNPGHLTLGGRPVSRIVARPDSETTMDGNSVVLEEQMVRAAETRMAFETGLALYQKGLAFVRMAAKPPGR